MCRHTAYIGPGIALTEVTRDLDHSLLHQSYAPRELLTGTVCADGHGLGWYDTDTRPEPARYVSTLPIWNDTNLPAFGPLVRSGLVMAAVRNATVAASLAPENCAPFSHGRFLFSLNGYLDGFDEVWKDRFLDDWIERDRHKGVRGTTDAEHIFHMILDRMDVGLANATQSVMRDLLEHAGQHGLDAQLNLLVADGEQVVASRAGSMECQNSLYHLDDGEEFPGAHVVASEPLYDDPLWQPVEGSSVLVLRAGAPPVRLRV